MSKRKLKQFVDSGVATGWDDPRMPTLRGMRRRGIPAAAIREFANRIGVARADSEVEYGFLEFCVRENLNRMAPRRMAGLDPLKGVFEDCAEGGSELLDAVNNPEDESAGMRQVPFSREIYIERDDFMEDPPKKFFRLGPGREVRLRYAYYVTCTDVITDADGNIVELRCTYDPATRGGDSPDGRKVRGTMHWVSAEHARSAEVRRFESLSLAEPAPGEDNDAAAAVNPNSLRTVAGVKIEPALVNDPVGAQVQFERLGYFCVDPDSATDKPVFNEIVPLKDTWKKVQKKG